MWWNKVLSEYELRYSSMVCMYQKLFLTPVSVWWADLRPIRLSLNIKKGKRKEPFWWGGLQPTYWGRQGWGGCRVPDSPAKYTGKLWQTDNRKSYINILSMKSLLFEINEAMWCSHRRPRFKLGLADNKSIELWIEMYLRALRERSQVGNLQKDALWHSWLQCSSLRKKGL